MKNIYLIGTDKQTVLFDKHGVLEYNRTPPLYGIRNLGWGYKNIYITRDEDVDRDDWYICTRNSQPKQSLYNRGKIKSGKIVLTTDPKLIEDGVQKIDDAFLEWFCKNSKCEYVEVIKYHGIKTSIAEMSLVGGDDRYNWKGIGDFRDYKIIIPTEETKPHSFCETPEEKCTMNYCDENGCQNRKKELLEPNNQEPIKDLEFYRKNAEENYITTPISVLAYISRLEEANENNISLERAKKYARHQHYLGSTKQSLVEFEDWQVK